MPIEPDTSVQITAAETPAEIVRTSYDEAFYSAISEFLDWSVRIQHGTRTPPDRVRSEDIVVPQFEDARTVAREAVESVGDPLRELQGVIESVTVKTDKSDLVTRADYIAENILTTVIENEFPSHNIRSEETVKCDRDSKFTWLIDPLDGTGNYASGNSNYCVSAALLQDGEPVVGAVYAPETDECWTAIRGGTARRDGQPLSTTTCENLDESMLISGYDPDGTFLTHFCRDVRGIRRLGATALNLCYLASENIDGIWEYDTHPWNVTAGVVIAEAAGATLTDTDGNRFTVESMDQRTPLVGTNGPLHETILTQLSQNDCLTQ
jgi:myo-inositol-1(or 4)-monophosphatase